MRKFFEASNPWALRAIAERLLEAADRGLWSASEAALATLRPRRAGGRGLGGGRDESTANREVVPVARRGRCRRSSRWPWSWRGRPGHRGSAAARARRGARKSTVARGLASAAARRRPVRRAAPRGDRGPGRRAPSTWRPPSGAASYRFPPGLLAAADGGVLYVDEVNLLADHLVDVLLDAAASGVNRVERDGVSHVHPSRFVLVGSMNPEEGELRPQLLDRFGLAVGVRSPTDPALRAEAVRRRLAFDKDPGAFRARWAEAEQTLADRVATTVSAPLAPGLEEDVARLCAAAGAEGLRADLTLCRAAAALAGWEASSVADTTHVRRVASLVLAHRRATPFERPLGARTDLDDLLDDTLGDRVDPDVDARADEPAGSERSTGERRPANAAPRRTQHRRTQHRRTRGRGDQSAPAHRYRPPRPSCPPA